MIILKIFLVDRHVSVDVSLSDHLLGLEDETVVGLVADSERLSDHPVDLEDETVAGLAVDAE
jgi:hypothetical protein